MDEDMMVARPDGCRLGRRHNATWSFGSPPSSSAMMIDLADAFSPDGLQLKPFTVHDSIFPPFLEGFVFQTPIAQVQEWVFGMGHSPHIKWVSGCDSGTLFVHDIVSGQSGS
ncbi:hypothetical protein HYALB_00012361 [Hymenoscyphus albidus]|uniref:Uncharacterized protein n=1 Tax=Hymenoscyphus albidus TaxID=595503 RepID=A0A9N9LLH9_9HELO|nr:hypothetical protein HYALB_00012361 [Hymenoscyphus albidus]